MHRSMSRAFVTTAFSAFLFASVNASAAATETWEIDAAHSSARFRIKHLMITNVSGEITGIKGTLTVDAKDMAKSKIEVTLDPATVNTNNAKRDEHLRDADFFDAKKNKAITFKSKKWAKDGDKWKITGDLTMRGVTKEVTLEGAELTVPITDPWKNQKRGFTAHTKINRKDYGMKWNKDLDGGGVVLGDEANVEIEVELQQSPKAPKG